jgi:glycerol uptake facilitator protein
MHAAMVGEFMGTLVLVIVGNGVIACVSLGRSKGLGGGWIAVATGWGFAAMAGIFTANACGSADAHINPVVTLAVAIATGDYSKVLPYFAAQMLGGFVGSVIVWLQYLPHWAETPDPWHKLACFCSHPAIPNVRNNLIAEIVPTFTLVFVAVSIVSRVARSGAVAGSLTPFLVGGLVWAIIISMAGPTGTSMNPARDLGSRIAHQILPIAGKGHSDWGYAPISLIGTCVGGALAGLLIHFLHII